MQHSHPHYCHWFVTYVARHQMPSIVARVLGVFNVIANTASRNESIFQLLHGGGGIILRSLGSFADLDRVPTNIADLDKGIGTAI